jgi:hypothetical protein
MSKHVVDLFTTQGVDGLAGGVGRALSANRLDSTLQPAALRACTLT